MGYRANAPLQASEPVEVSDMRKSDPVLTRLKSALTEHFGPRLDRAVLFGSRARGDFRADSDYDVAVFLHDYSSFWTELQPLGAITTDILMDTGAVISAKPFRAGSYNDPNGLMCEIARDGLDL